ncbi:MAG: hypothetical protein ABIN01_08875 [Ferruginibacter sp.]
MIEMLNSIFTRLGFQVKKTTALENEQRYLKSVINCLEDLYAYRLQNDGTKLNNEISGIIFSKNRAMQLHALLQSYFHYTINPAPLKVLFTTDSPEHERAYEILQQEFRSAPVEFICETDFRSQLQTMVKESKSGRIFFMTDDAIFVERYDLSTVRHFNPLAEIFSLRLGRDVHFSFTHNKEQILPEFNKQVINDEYFNSWIWNTLQGSPDWSYPLSVDATIFSRDEVDIMLKHLDFKNPNSLEGSLQLLSKAFLTRKGICFEKAKYVNVPCNIVQDEFSNIYTGTFSVLELLKLFMDGKRIDWKLYTGMNAKDVQHIRYDFI